MTNLTQAHRELFRRTADETFSSLAELETHCRRERDESLDRWHLPQRLLPSPAGDTLELSVGDDGSHEVARQTIGNGVRRESAPAERAHTATIGANPQRPGVVFEQAPDEVARQSVSPGVLREPATGEARNPAAPNQPLRVVERTVETFRQISPGRWEVQRQVFALDGNNRLSPVLTEKGESAGK